MFSTFRGERLLTELRTDGDPARPETRKLIQRLVDLGPGVIPLVHKAIGEAGKKETMALVEVLSGLANDRTLAKVAAGLADDNPRVVSAVAWALAGSRNLSPAAILDLLKDPELSRAALVDVITAQKERFQVRDLLGAAASLESGDKASLYKIVGEIADENAIPDLIARVDGKDPVVRRHMLEILARFQTPAVERAITAQIKDPNKFIRQAVLAALSKFDRIAEIEPVVNALADSDIEVQNRAVDVLIRVKNPQTVRYLVNVLQDESEYARRSAVEVLNEIGTADSVKYLLDAIKDADWWVRSRAADALGKIGGPRVVDAVLELVKDKDEELRRTAIEILNLTRDERAVSYLIEATKDPDWWVSERAIDALGSMKEGRAVPRLVEILKTNPKAAPVAIRALGQIGKAATLDVLMPYLASMHNAIRVEAMVAVARVADTEHADLVRREIAALGKASDNTLQIAAKRALAELENRLSETGDTHSRLSVDQQIETSRTMLAEAADVAEIVKQNESVSSPLDISTLNPGDVVEGRYRFIEKIGKGAFGTVLLMEDTVVDERLILKFLNPNVSQDEEMMKRFVHELRYSRKITHPNVIRIYDFLYIRGNYAISMEYFKSHTLGQELSQGQPIELQRALRFADDIATGMAVAHLAGVVHRDLKPANVLINDEGLLKIVDFGVAAVQREGDTQLTKTGYVIGSPKYMAPEQILGKKVDPRADVYSLGVILYEMTTGVPPYSRGDHMSVMYQHVQGKAAAPIDVNKSMSKDLSDFIMKAMSVDKSKRFQSMEEFKAELARFR